MPEPTRYLPGTPAFIEVLAARQMNNECLRHPDDRQPGPRDGMLIKRKQHGDWDRVGMVVEGYSKPSEAWDAIERPVRRRRKRRRKRERG